MEQEHIELLTQGKLCFEKEDYDQAVLYFDEYFEKTDDFTAHPLIVESLLKQGEEHIAFVRLSEFDKKYRSSPELHELYVTVLLKKKLYLRIAIWLNGIGNEERAKYIERYKSSMIYWTTLDNRYYQSMLRDFDRVLDLPKSQQVQLMRQMSFLTPGDFLDFSERALLDPNLSAIVRPQLLDYMIRLNQTKTITYLDYLGVEQVLLVEDCQSLEEVFSKQTVLMAVTDYVVNHQPTMIELVSSSVSMHIGLLYPLSLEVMSPVDLWVEAYLLTFELKATTDFPEQQEEINKIMDMIRLMDEQMMDNVGF